MLKSLEPPTIRRPKIDIEAIRKRFEHNSDRSFEGCSDSIFSSIQRMLDDIEDLLAYIFKLETEKKELESRLRWNNTIDDIPAIGIMVELRDEEQGSYTLGCVKQRMDSCDYYWSTQKGEFDVSYFPEWQEI